MTDTHLTSLADNDGDASDQLLQLGLREVLGGETPPDLSEQILAEFEASPSRRVSLAKKRMNRQTRLALRWGVLVAAAASLFAMLGLAERGLSNAARVAAINNSRQIGSAALNDASALSRFPTASDYANTLPGKQKAGTEYYTVNIPEQKRTEQNMVMSAVQGERTEQYTVNVAEPPTVSFELKVPTAETPAPVFELDNNGGGWKYEPVTSWYSEAQGGKRRARFFAAIDNSNSMESIAGKEVDRKIRYNASVKVIVDQFDEVADNVTALVKKHEGFVASTNLGQMRGKQRSGNWVVRIPTANYDAFIGSIDEVGVLDSRSEKAQDVTAQYVDLESRIASKQKLEERIIKLLERPDDKLKEVIEVERELARVRQEIEQMQGQLRVMADQTSLATITLNVREERDYVPPTAPTVSSRLANAWSNGFSRSGNFLMNLSIWLIERFIPMVVCVVGAVVGLRFVRGWWKRRAQKVG